MSLTTDEAACAARLHIARSGGVVWIEGAVMDNRPHRHHALQLTWAAPGAWVELSAGGLTLRERAVAVDGGVTHALRLERGVVALVDSASRVARRLRERVLAGEPCAALRVSGEDGALEEARAWLNGLEHELPDVEDARVAEVLVWLDALEARGEWSAVSLDGALALACLSRSRFLHLFSEQVGSPWRTYLVWRRALVALTLASRGASLTEAAHEAGYSDSAHLSRQFAALFGVTPSSVVQNSHFVQS